MKEVLVTKMDGSVEPYNEKKLIRSLRKSGADEEIIKKIIPRVGRILHDGIETKRLFNFVHKQLRKASPGVCCRYNLKQGIINMRLHGGYVFEKYMGRILAAKGYDIKMNQTVQGKFVTHEIDVVAEKGKEKLMVETKHHVKPWASQPIQTALYVYARFLDVSKIFTKPMLVTNTKFSSQATKYAKGVGLRLMGWKYPRGDSLEENIENLKLYPITILYMSRNTIEKYLEQGVLTLQDLAKEDIPLKIRRQIDQVLIK